MDFKDYYKVLGLTKKATADEIKKAYRKLARKHHPDVNPGDAGAESTFKNINEAHEVLGDPEKRRKYDTLGSNWRQYENVNSGEGSPFGQGGRWTVNVPGGHRGGGSTTDFREAFGESGFSDFFSTFFGGQASPGAGRQTQDTEYELELGLEDAFRGVTRRITIPDSPPRTVDVKIPSGVKTGSRVRVPGEGRGRGGGAGDLYLRIRLRPHAVFEVKGQNLYVSTVVPVTTAALGGEVDVPTLDGASLRLKIPAGTQPAQVFRLRGKGMPGVKPQAARGDLYATARVAIPATLSAKARQHYEALAALSD